MGCCGSKTVKTNQVVGNSSAHTVVTEIKTASGKIVRVIKKS